MCIGCALHADGTPHPGATNLDGANISRLTYKKCMTEYSELATSAELVHFDRDLACEPAKMGAMGVWTNFVWFAIS